MNTVLSMHLSTDKYKIQNNKVSRNRAELYDSPLTFYLDDTQEFYNVIPHEIVSVSESNPTLLLESVFFLREEATYYYRKCWLNIMDVLA